VIERIDYEPPGGMLGIVMTPTVIESELTRAFAHRQERVVEILHQGS
jgi:hypothetical protein